MAQYFATVQQSSKEGVTERECSRRRSHDSPHSVAGYPRGATGPAAITPGPQVRGNYYAMFGMEPCRVSQERVRYGSRIEDK